MEIYNFYCNYINEKILLSGESKYWICVICGIIFGICLLTFINILKNKIVYKLLVVTVDSENQAHIRDNLNSEKICFKVEEIKKRKKGIIAFHGNITGYYNFEEKNTPQYTYVFYVKRWQYEKALSILNK